LTLSELGVAIGTQPSVFFSYEEVVKAEVETCGSFIKFQNNSENVEVGLVHLSVKDYLLRKTKDLNPELELFRVQEKAGNLEIATKCFNYLQDDALVNRVLTAAQNKGTAFDSRKSFRIFQETIRKTCLKTFPLLEYATLHWPEHTRPLSPSEDIFDLSLPFYNRNSQARWAWLEIHGVLIPGKRRRGALYRPSRPPLPDVDESWPIFHLASSLDIVPLAKRILFGKKSWGARLKNLASSPIHRRHMGFPALHYAAGSGHVAMTQFLLENGADVHARDTVVGKTALNWALRGEVAQLLLQYGAKVV